MTPQPYPYGSTPNEDAETTRDVARQQGDEVKDEVAQQAQSVASTVADETSHVGTTGFDGMVDDVESFARRRPGAFLAGAAVAGFAASRLGRGVQASQQEQNGSGTSSVGEASTRQAARLWAYFCGLMGYYGVHGTCACCSCSQTAWCPSGHGASLG